MDQIKNPLIILHLMAKCNNQAGDVALGNLVPVEPVFRPRSNSGILVVALVRMAAKLAV